jgi:hypothetical protein
MRIRSAILGVVLAVAFQNLAAWADQIILRDGTAYSGKFVRGDANGVEFRVLGRIETFKIANIAQIIFKEPELGTAASAPATNVPKTTTAKPQPAPTAATMQSDAATGNISSIAPAPPEPSVRPQLARREDALQQNYPSMATTLPTGTPLKIRTAAAIDTDRNRVGDIFDATLDEALVSDGRTLVARGAAIKGRIAYAKESGKLAGQSQLILELIELSANGKTYLLRTSDYIQVGSSRENRTAATVGGTAALGAIIGAIAGGGKGAAVGAASGAAVGTGVQVLTKGQVLRVPAETILEFKLQSPLTLDAQ